MASLKLVTLGSPFVGKTCLLDRWVNASYRPDQDPTCHVGYLSKRFEIDGEAHAFTLWDTAGQDKFRASTAAYCRNARGALLVFDITEPATFAALPEWIALLHAAGEGVPIVVAGNKADLTAQVSADAIAAFCSENGNLPYFETSAATGMGVDSAFESLCRAAIERTRVQASTETLPPTVDITAGAGAGAGTGTGTGAATAHSGPAADGGRCC